VLAHVPVRADALKLRVGHIGLLVNVKPVLAGRKPGKIGEADAPATIFL